MKGQPFARRLGFALAGLRDALRREASFRAQMAAAVAMYLVLAVTRPPAIWWAICTLAASMVLVAELLNTALEALADRLHPEQHPGIRFAKDVAAGAVLIAATCALVIAVCLLVR
ncbi:MAG: diacylglycerol kinase [Steroidobacteraceae bacterium]